MYRISLFFVQNILVLPIIQNRRNPFAKSWTSPCFLSGDMTPRQLIRQYVCPSVSLSVTCSCFGSTCRRGRLDVPTWAGDRITLNLIWHGKISVYTSPVPDEWWARRKKYSLEKNDTKSLCGLSMRARLRVWHSHVPITQIYHSPIRIYLIHGLGQ